MLGDGWEKSSGLNNEERGILKDICDEIGVPADIVEKMISAEQKVYGMGRRHFIKAELEALVIEGVQATEGQR